MSAQSCRCSSKLGCHMGAGSHYRSARGSQRLLVLRTTPSGLLQPALTGSCAQVPGDFTELRICH
jgi:hypothetical protein